MATGSWLPKRVTRLREGGVLLLAAALLATLLTGQSDAETRGFAISLIHMATNDDSANCPQGGNGGVPDIQKRALVRMGYLPAAAAKIVANNGVDADGRKVNVALRGRVNGQPASVLVYPTSVPDPQIETVQGRYASGFDLDGKDGPSSFEDPDTHERGVDNQLWRALGCFAVYSVKFPIIPYNEAIAWDTAMDSMPAWLVSISGADLTKDGEVTVTFDRALNVVMRDNHGSVLQGSSYTVDPDPRSHSEFKGHLTNGVLTIQPGTFFMQGESQFYAVLRFTQTHLRLKLNSDGSLAGIIGGYQPWMDYYTYLSIRGEETGQVDLPGVYYALKRLADGLPDPQTHDITGISAAYYIEAEPAFLITQAGQLLASAHLPATSTPPTPATSREGVAVAR